MPGDFAARYGPWALVTGASSGLGAAYAGALARRGLSVALVARREERLLALAERLRETHGVEALAVAEDLALPGAAERVALAVGPREVGLLVNNAGFGFSGRFTDGDAERDARMVLVNCVAPLALTHRFLPPMLSRGRGGLVFVASTAAFQPTPFFAVYGATKAFDLMLAEALWSELRGSGVTVQAACPGQTATEFAERAHFAAAPGGADPVRVVELCLSRLGRGPTCVPGAGNKLTAFLHRLVPRRVAANATAGVLARQLLATTAKELRRRPT
jgi:uncharacterized protein